MLTDGRIRTQMPISGVIIIIEDTATNHIVTAHLSSCFDVTSTLSKLISLVPLIDMLESYSSLAGCHEKGPRRRFRMELPLAERLASCCGTETAGPV